MSQPASPVDQPRVVVNTSQLIDPPVAEQRRRAGAVVIDVRRKKASPSDGDIEGAIKVDKAIADALIAPDSPTQLAELAPGPDTEIVVFCNSEFGSDPIVGKLNDYGFRNVRHVRGGYPAWDGAEHNADDSTAASTAADAAGNPTEAATGTDTHAAGIPSSACES